MNLHELLITTILVVVMFIAHPVQMAIGATLYMAASLALSRWKL